MNQTSLKRKFANRTNKQKQRGAGMIDLVLSIFGSIVIVGFAFWLKSVAWGPMLGWMEASAVSTAMSKIENTYTGAASFNGLTTAGMATSDVFDRKYLPGAGAITNRFGGTVTLGVTTINTNNDTQQFTDGGVRSDSCSTLVNQLVDDADRITVAGTVVKPKDGVIDATALKTQCGSAAVVSVLFERIKRA